MDILYSSRFERSFKKLPKNLIEKTIKQIKLFEKNQSDSRLDVHKLHGKLKNQWSFSVNRKNRILFEYDGEDIILLDIGDHNLYR